MTDKERLEEIKRFTEQVTDHLAYIGVNDFHWLIEQVERVQELEEHQDRWLSGQNMAVNTYNDIRSLGEENKRFREALKTIKESSPDKVSSWIASKALEGDAHD